MVKTQVNDPSKHSTPFLAGLHAESDRLVAQSGRVGLTHQLVARGNWAAEIHRKVHERRADVAVDLKLEPAIAIEMRLPPSVDRIEREIGQPRGIGDLRRVTIAPGDVDLVNEVFRGHKAAFICSGLRSAARDVGYLLSLPARRATRGHTAHQKPNVHMKQGRGWWRYLDLNQGPNDYESFALTN